MASGQKITDPYILSQLGGGASTAPAPRVVMPAPPPQLKPGETPVGKRELEAGTAPVPTQQIYQELAASKSQLGTAMSNLGRVEAIYNRSLKGKEPWRVAREYFPNIAPGSSVSQDVGRMRTAASQLYSLAAQITRIPGEGEQNAAEFKQKIEAFKIDPSDKDEVIEEKLSGLRDLFTRRLAFVNQRMAEVKPGPSPQMRAAQATIRPSKTLRYDAQGNRITK